MIDHLEITVAHHGDDEFYTLARVMESGGGGFLSWNAEVISDVTHEVHPARLFEMLPNTPCERADGKSTCPEFCVIIEACNDRGDHIDDLEVTVEIADALLDGKFVERLATARGNLAEHYAYEQRRPEGVDSWEWFLRLAEQKAPGR